MEMVKEAKNVFKTGAATTCSVLSYWSQQVDLWHHRAPWSLCLPSFHRV